VLAVAVGVVLTLVLFALVRHQEDRIAHERLRRLASEHFRSAMRELVDQQLVIESARALWAASDRVDGDEFEEFVALLLESYPRLLSIEWTPAVPAEEREAFERATREQLPGFELHELGPTGQRIPARDRALHYPVLYAAPSGATDVPVGFDLGSDVAQREAFERAAATGVRQTRGPYRHHRDAEGLVFHTALPVYERPGVPGSTEERAESLLGFIVCAFDAEHVLDPPSGTLAQRPVSVEVTDAIRGTRLAPTGSGDEPAQRIPAGPPEITHVLDLGGLQWRLDYRPVELAGDVLHIPSYLLLGFGLTLTLILTMHLRSSRERGRVLAESNWNLTRLVRLREEAEAEAREAQRRHATLLSNLPGMCCDIFKVSP
jgi:CHASE1-domain containing sensor protein